MEMDISTPYIQQKFLKLKEDLESESGRKFIFFETPFDDDSDPGYLTLERIQETPHISVTKEVETQIFEFRNRLINVQSQSDIDPTALSKQVFNDCIQPALQRAKICNDSGLHHIKFAILLGSILGLSYDDDWIRKTSYHVSNPTAFRNFFNEFMLMWNQIFCHPNQTIGVSDKKERRWVYDTIVEWRREVASALKSYQKFFKSAPLKLPILFDPQHPKSYSEQREQQLLESSSKTERPKLPTIKEQKVSHQEVPEEKKDEKQKVSHEEVPEEKKDEKDKPKEDENAQVSEVELDLEQSNERKRKIPPEEPVRNVKKIAKVKKVVKRVR